MSLTYISLSRFSSIGAKAYTWPDYAGWEVWYKNKGSQSIAQQNGHVNLGERPLGSSGNLLHVDRAAPSQGSNEREANLHGARRGNLRQLEGSLSIYGKLNKLRYRMVASGM